MTQPFGVDIQRNSGTDGTSSADNRVMHQEVVLVLPNQLFKDHPCLGSGGQVFLVEEYLFFRQYRFHKQKLAYHRATMQYYRGYLESSGYRVTYVDSLGPLHHIDPLIAHLSANGVDKINLCDPVDDWIEQRLQTACQREGITLSITDTPLFINTRSEIQAYFSGRKRFFQTDFYIDQRRKRRILLEPDNQPAGGKWTYDTDNRKKYPKGKVPPVFPVMPANEFDQEAKVYVETHFSSNPGRIQLKYPSTHEEAEVWFDQFLTSRFAEFGVYEDAMVEGETILHHSVLTPMLNSGLLLPDQVIDRAITYAKTHDIPLNSLEGFIRQILGWREFIRAVYLLRGREERTTNFWNFTHPMPSAFYTAETGITPLDDVIRKVLDHAYSHHIDRLMVLGNMMLLTEIHPDHVYRWFMEMYIDAYDWVMVPNVYGMSQFADGGIFATKPYMSGSNYVLKMSNYQKGEWCDIWDALFWSFMNRHRDFFLTNPRLGMLIRSYDRMSEEKKSAFESTRDVFLARLGLKDRVFHP